jgi:EAL domain-containing protein (putative c-di-GMP-specific phosphodiesterase class I)
MVGGSKDRPLGDLLSKALAAMRTHLGMDVAFIAQFEGDRRVFRYVDTDLSQPPIKAGEGGPLAESFCLRVADGRLPRLIRNAADVPVAAAMPVTRELPVGAHISVPIMLEDGSVYGTFCCFSFQPDYSLTERDLKMFEVFAAVAGHQIQAELERTHAQRLMRMRIEQVLGDRQFFPVYQPIIDIGANAPIGYETLTRFTAEPRRSPDQWFGDAGRVGLGLELELATMRSAVGALSTLPARTYLSINGSPATFNSPRLADLLSCLPLDRIVLELTEHEVVSNYAEMSASIAGLRAGGARIAVDDAGAGYASFRHILQLRPEFIKLDTELTRDIHTDPGRQALATAFVHFATATGAQLVAEGVETDEQLAALVSLGITRIQGYLKCRPLPLEEVLRLS